MDRLGPSVSEDFPEELLVVCWESEVAAVSSDPVDVAPWLLPVPLPWEVPSTLPSQVKALELASDELESSEVYGEVLLEVTDSRARSPARLMVAET